MAYPFFLSSLGMVISNKRRGFPELRNQRTFKEPFWIKKKKIN